MYRELYEFHMDWSEQPIHPIIPHPRSRVIFRLWFSGKANNRRSLGKFLLRISQEVNHSFGVQSLQIISIIDGHFQPEIESDYEFSHWVEVILQSLIDRLQMVALPNHHRAIISVFVIFLAGQITSAQSGELAIIWKELIQGASDDHIQINVEFAARDGDIEESDLTPPSLPSFLQLLHFYIWMQTVSIVSEAIESDFPSSVL